MTPARQRKDALKALRRRRDFLQARVSSAAPNQQLGFDVREIQALEFALGAFEDAEAIGLEGLGALSLDEREALRALLEGYERAA